MIYLLHILNAIVMTTLTIYLGSYLGYPPAGLIPVFLYVLMFVNLTEIE